MDTESKSGQTVLAMKGNGNEIKLMAGESSGMLMGMFSMESGKMTKQTDTVSIRMSMELNTRAIGKTICKMATELRPGQIAPSTRATIKKERSTERGPTSGAMDQNM